MSHTHHLKNISRVLRKNMTPAEWIMWDILRGDQCAFKFRRQQQIGPYIVDFYCPALKLIIEVDGGGHGGLDDIKRDAFLNKEGFFVLRFWNNDVQGNIDSVWVKIDSTIKKLNGQKQPTPTLTLPPQGGGETSQ